METNSEYKHNVLVSDGKKGINVWMYVSVILAVALVISLMAGRVNSGSSTAANKALEYINNNLVESGTSAEIVETKETNGVIEMTLNVEGRNVNSYVTKDGKFLFVNAFDLDKPIDTNSNAPDVNTEGKRIEVSADDDPSIGSENASVTIVEFSDFQCPFCARAVPTVKQILKEYDGKVKIVYRDFPLGFHENAQKAAEASECADEQGKFWEYHDLLFENQGNLDAVSLKKYAKDLKLNTSEFDACLDSGKYAAEVQKDASDGQSYGVSGTPAFFINGRLVSGAQPFENFKKIIDEELAGQ